MVDCTHIGGGGEWRNMIMVVDAWDGNSSGGGGDGGGRGVLVQRPRSQEPLTSLHLHEEEA